MIFSSQDTAARYRARAAEQLNEDVLHIAKELLSHADMLNAKDEESRTALLKSVIHQKLSENNRLWKTLLYRSGIILSDHSDDTYDSIFIYHDRDYEDGFPVTNAIREAGSLSGGINSTTGQIHT